jgi:hypothetical protein
MVPPWHGVKTTVVAFLFIFDISLFASGREISPQCRRPQKNRRREKRRLAGFDKRLTIGGFTSTSE